MSKSLVIVESPSKAKTINKYLGKDFIVESTVGHIKDLPKKDSIDIENGFKPKYITIRGKADVIKKLKTEAAKVDKVFIATDPDREGEAIAWHVENELRGKNDNIYRVEFNEVTKKAVMEAIAHPRKVDTNRVASQQARRVVDRIVGFQVSEFLWKSIYYGLSAGRVQSVALRLICEREVEIRNFTPEEYWTIDGDFGITDSDVLTARLVKIDGKKAVISNGDAATEHEANINASSFTIQAVNKRQTKQEPKPPFTTSTLQQDAIRRLRMSSKRVMSTAQKLYEGIKIGSKGQLGLITYMRTDSVRISNDAMDQVRTMIGNMYGADDVNEKPRFFKGKKSAQDAHEAIRPTQLTPEFAPNAIKEYLDNDQFRLYQLIWNRFTASQMKPARIQKTAVEIGDARYLFRATGQIIEYPGFLKVYEIATGNDDDTTIPKSVAENMLVKTLKIEPEQHFTRPPARYTESTIVKEMDEQGIGRPSTYTSIITTLLERKYVTSEERKLAATELGEVVNEILIQSFPDLIDVDFTAKMEDRLDEIENEAADYQNVVSDFYGPFKQTVDAAIDRSTEIKSSIQQETEYSCDNCGKPMVIKWSRNGKFLACTGYPECRNTMNLENGKPVSKEIVYTEHTCENDGARMILKSGRYGEYLECENYPACETRKPVPTGISCPSCKTGEVGQRRSKRGKIFYGCSNYPECKFVAWNPVVNQDCPSCGNNYMVQKVTKAKGEHLQCPECKHEILVATAEDGSESR